MYIFCLILFVVQFLHDCIGLTISGKHGASLQEVPFGENVVLSCRSNDKDHIFEHWILDNNVIVGPRNEDFDNVKFNYEVLSGNLIIKAVSQRDEGFYTCVSRAVRGEDRKVEKIQVLVAQDWENVYEHDYNINLIRILIILIMLVLLVIGGYVVYKMWRERYMYPNYLEQEDDDEGIFKAPSTSGMSSPSSSRRIVLCSNSPNPLTNNLNGTDFKSILEKSNE